MNLNLITLQFAQFFDQIARIFSFESETGGLPVVTNVVPWMILAVMIVIFYIGWRYRTNMHKYPNPEARVGTFTILWQGQYEFKGNMSRLTTPLSQKTLDELEQEPDWKNGIKELENLVKNKLIFLYEMNITEWNDALNIKAKESALIISPVDIAIDKYSWEDTKQKLSLSTMTYEQNRYLVVFESSKMYEITTLDETIREVFVLAPIPRYTEKVGETLTINMLKNKFEKDKIGINIIELPMMDKLAEIVPKLVGMAKATSMIRSRNISIKNLNDVVKKRDDVIAETTEELSISRAIASTNALIGDVDKTEPEKPPSPIIWFALFGIGALVGTRLHVMAPEFESIDPVAGGVLGMIIVGGIYLFMGKPKEKTEKIVE